MNDAIEARYSEQGHARKPFVYALLFWLAVLCFELTVFGVGEAALLRRHLANGDILRILVLLFLSAASLGLSLLFFTSAFLSPVAFRIVYFLIFAVITIGEYSHFKAFGTFSKAQIIAIGFFSADWRFAARAFEMYFEPLALLPILVFAVLLFHASSARRNGWRALAATSILCFGFFAASAYFTHNSYFVPSLGSGFRTLVSFPVIWHVGTASTDSRRAYYRTERDEISFQTPDRPDRNIIFIVDESVRGDYLSLNGHPRSTTPFLEFLADKKLVTNWGTAVSGTTCSSTSNDLLLTGLNELPDTDFKIYRMPTLFHYAKAMNFKTYLIDGQVSGLWYGKPSDIGKLDHWIRAEDLNPSGDDTYDTDFKIAEKIREIVGGSTGNFIWINKFGVHTPYSRSYPSSDQTSLSDQIIKVYSGEVDTATLVQTYEEALRYNVNGFFERLFFETEVRPGDFYIYTADHGQTLRETGTLSSHCNESRGAASVPLLIVANPQTVAGIDSSFSAAHSNIFATILDLMRFPESERRYPYAPSLFKTKASDSRPRSFYAGDLHGNDGSGYHQFD